MMLARRFVVFAAALVACTPTPKHTIPIAVLVEGDRAAVGALPEHAVPGLELRAIALPAPAAPPIDDRSAIIARARSAYAKGDFDTCRAELAKVDVGKLLASGERTLAARALASEAACAWGAMDRGAAKTAAARLAAFGLELPDVALPPDVERVIGDAIATAGKAPRTSLAVTGEVGARLTIDGRPGGCALPCAIDVGPGDHVLAVEADGFQPASRTVRTPDTSQVALEQERAPAELAARQWRARVGRGLPLTDPTGAALLGALGGSRIAVIRGDAQLSGALVVDGKLRASVVRDRGDGTALVRELAYDGGVLTRPALWQRPWFWIVTSSAVAVIAGAIVAVTYKRPVHTSLGL